MDLKEMSQRWWSGMEELGKGLTYVCDGTGEGILEIFSLRIASSTRVDTTVEDENDRGK